MSTAAIKRGTPTRRAQVKVVKKPKRPPLLSRMIASIPISARMVEKAVTVAIISTVIVGVIAIALMLDLPRRAGIAMGETVGRAGYSVKHIDVSGIDRMDRLSVYAVALDQQSIAMPLVDLEAVRQKLLKYGWVADARVSRRFPDTLAIDIVERKPAAVWQHDQQLTLVDANGIALEPVKLEAMPDLPLIIGPDANAQATELTALMGHAPQLKPVLDGAIWVGNRRWDLRFQSGETLMLPEGDLLAGAALKRFAELDAARRLLGQGVARFDMRNPDQMVIQPGPKREVHAAPATTGTTKPVDPSLAT
jgi:cell division protein FtsQ